LRIAVVAANHVALGIGGCAPLVRVFEQRLPKRRIVLPPTEKTEIAAQRARCDVERDERRFNGQRPRAAHRIDEADGLAGFGNELLPARAEQHGGGEIFLERRRTLRAAITAPMQTVTGEIERQRRDVAMQV
jgi:hypothetical protein